MHVPRETSPGLPRVSKRGQTAKKQNDHQAPRQTHGSLSIYLDRTDHGGVDVFSLSGNVFAEADFRRARSGPNRATVTLCTVPVVHDNVGNFGVDDAAILDLC